MLLGARPARRLSAGLLAAALLALAARPGETKQREEDSESIDGQAGDGIERIGIDELVEVTVSRAPGLARAQANAGIARAEERVVRGRDDWGLELAIDGTRISRDPIPGQPIQLVSQWLFTGTAALTRDLPTGGQLRLEVSGARNEEINFIETQNETGGITTVQSESGVSQATGRITLNHSLLRGFGPKIARADREQAVLRTSAAILRGRVAAGELTRDMVRGYWELAHAALSLEVRRSSLAAVRKLHKETEQVVREGGRPIGDLKLAEYNMAIREESQLRAELALQEQSLALRKLAGLEIGAGAIALWPGDLPGIGQEAYAVDEFLSRGMARNPALAAIALDDADAKIEVRVADDGVRPRLDFTVSAGTTAAGANVDESFNALGEGGNLEARTGLVFSIDIGANAARGRREAAQLRHRVVRIEKEELRREIASAIVLTVHQVRAAQKRAEVAAKAIELAKGSLTSERALFRVGRSTSQQLFDRQDDLDEARLSRVRAVADYHEGVAALQSLTGDILAHYRIQVLE